MSSGDEISVPMDQADKILNSESQLVRINAPVGRLRELIRSEKDKSYEEGLSLRINYNDPEMMKRCEKLAIDKRNKEIISFIEDIKWDGRLSQGQMFDKILDFVKK